MYIVMYKNPAQISYLFFVYFARMEIVWLIVIVINRYYKLVFLLSFTFHWDSMFTNKLTIIILFYFFPNLTLSLFNQKLKICITKKMFAMSSQNLQ